jgi:hypothetical protein
MESLSRLIREVPKGRGGYPPLKTYPNSIIMHKQDACTSEGCITQKSPFLPLPNPQQRCSVLIVQLKQKLNTGIFVGKGLRTITQINGFV